MNEDELRRRFDYHAPDEHRADYHQTVRRECRDLAASLSEFLPAGREFALAITKLEEVMFWANAAIARGGTN